MTSPASSLKNTQADAASRSRLRRIFGSERARGSDPLVRTECVRILYRTMPIAQLCNFVIAAIAVIVMKRSAPFEMALAWAAAIYALSALRLYGAVIYRRQAPMDREQKKWQTYYVLGTLASGFLWGSAGLLIFSSPSIEAQFFISLVLGGMAMGSTATHAAYLPAFRAYAYPALLPLALIYMLVGTNALPHLFPAVDIGPGIGLGAGLVAFMFLLSLEFIARTYNDILVTSIVLSSSNARLVERLKEARSEAERANRAKSEFLANVSHELRTPLNAIIGFSEILKDEMFGPIGREEYKSYAKDIHYSGDHLLGLVNDILDVSKAESGKVDLNERVIDLRRAVARAISMVSKEAAKGDVEIRTELDPACTYLYADERMIRQILINLLSNSVRFTKKGGHITIRTRRGWRGDFVLSVTDTGIGMTPGDVPKALTKFGRVDGRRHAGAGLGLPLVKLLAELHGGAVEIETAPAQGTCVSLRLPENRISGDMSGSESAAASKPQTPAA